MQKRLLDKYKDQLYPGLTGLLSELVPVEISEIAAYFIKHFDYGEDIERLVRNIAPPWIMTWFEYELPKTMKVMIEGEEFDLTTVTQMISRIGLLQVVLPVDHSKKIVGEDPMMGMAKANGFQGSYYKAYLKKREAILASYSMEPHWLGVLKMFIELKGEVGLIRTHDSFHYIANDGSIFPDETSITIHFETKTKLDEGEGVLKSIFTVPALFATSLLNSKNVEAVDEQPDGLSKLLMRHKNRKKRQEQERRTVYKTLVVYAPGTKKKIVSSADEEGEGHAFHICRGHWADHREKGLFGKPELRGLYWVPQHVRGSREIGEVRKDYLIKKRP